MTSLTSYWQGLFFAGLQKYPNGRSPADKDVGGRRIIGTTTSGPLNVPAGEAISLDLVATTYGRGIVTSDRRDVQVTALIINTLTGETTSHIIMANTEGDFH